MLYPLPAQCAACHGPAGKGDPAKGAPDLTDGEWLYGPEREAGIFGEEPRAGLNRGFAIWRAPASRILLARSAGAGEAPAVPRFPRSTRVRQDQ